MSSMATEQVRAVWCCSVCGAIYHKDFPRCPLDGAEVVVSERDPLLGAAIGHYQITELIGEGGMGRVYLAHHAHLPNKRYAFKVLLGDHSASAAMRTRFTREAERASQLDHPNVARVVDYGQTEHGLPYIVMDYVDGPSLVGLIGEVPMPASRVVALAREICKGLEYAHAAGIVHRDLKPENILVSPGPGDAGGVPRLVDFGLALSIDQSDTRLTETGMTMGTPAFAAPEQLSGKPIDHRADLYALGMTMFEMLTGGLSAVEGTVMEVVAARTARDAPRLTERVPGLAVPHTLEDIVARLTRKRPGERYASAREVIDALDALDPRVLTGEVVEAAPAPPPVVAQLPLTTSDPALTAAEASPVVDPGTTDRLPSQRGRRQRAMVIGALAACGLVAIAVFTLGSRAAPPAAVLVAPAVVPAPTSAPAVIQPAALPEPPFAVELTPTPIPAPIAPPPPAPRVSEPRTAAAAVPRPAPAVTVAHTAHIEPSPPVADSEPTPAPPPPPAAPVALHTAVEVVKVDGSLPQSDIERGVQRLAPAVARCTPAAPVTLFAHFTIGDTRRARDLRIVGPASPATSCVAGALADVRTEGMPDTGDVEVTVKVSFAAGKT